MASSSDAFRKLESWKKSKAVLKVTVLTKGGVPDILTALVMATDEEAMKIALALLPSRGLVALDLAGARLEVGKRLVEATRSAEDVLSFEDTGERYKVVTRGPRR